MKSTPISPGCTGYIPADQLDAYLLSTRGQRQGTVSAKWIPEWQVFHVTEHAPSAAESTSS